MEHSVTSSQVSPLKFKVVSQKSVIYGVVEQQNDSLEILYSFY